MSNTADMFEHIFAGLLLLRPTCPSFINALIRTLVAENAHVDEDLRALAGKTVRLLLPNEQIPEDFARLFPAPAESDSGDSDGSEQIAEAGDGAGGSSGTMGDSADTQDMDMS